MFGGLIFGGLIFGGGLYSGFYGISLVIYHLFSANIALHCQNYQAHFSVLKVLSPAPDGDVVVGPPVVVD